MIDQIGDTYSFLLKGNEDQRQDERVMQVFGLVNKILQHNLDTNNADYLIRRYSITPISPFVGVVEWVGKSDTMHELIRDYRISHNIPIALEKCLISQVN